MSKSHYWVVCDAVDFIRSHGDKSEKRVLQNFELTYGRRIDISELSPRESAIETLVGFEALHTDKYSDLALEFSELKFLGKNNITGLAFHQFTAMNHFVNPYPETLDFWPEADGYSFGASSRTGFDSIIVEGMSQYLGARVDIEHSPIFSRIRDYCAQDCNQWDSNFRGLISKTKFAPWTALSLFYYDRLINRHFEPLEVLGPNPQIVGIQLLGPVVHALSDACSVQHVRGTLGYGHAVWENYLKSMVANQKLTVDPELVRKCMSEPPLDNIPRVNNSSGKAIVNISELVLQLSIKTADRLKGSTRQTWDALWSAGDDFWKKYLNGPSLESDTRHLYHMAVAATVKVLKEAYQDLVLVSIINEDGGLRNPALMPDITTVQGDCLSFSPGKISSEETLSEQKSDCLDDPAMLLGFNPDGRSNLSQNLTAFNRLFGSTTLEKLDTSKATELLEEIQKDLAHQYEAKWKVDGPKFCPLTSVSKIPLDSDLSAHWGIGTFRAPTLSELNEPGLFSEYVAMNDIHCYKAYKLQLTQLLAGLQFQKKILPETSSDQQSVGELMDRIVRMREFDSYDQAKALGLEPCREFRRREHRRASAKSVLAAAESKSESIWERIRNFFNIPMTALATAAAVALLLIMIYPRGGIEPLIGLSGETWEPPKPKLMAPKIVRSKPPAAAKSKAAVVVVFEKFRKTPDQQFIDSAYQALEPPIVVGGKYEFVSPAKIKQAIANGEIKSANVADFKKGLESNLKVSKLLIVTIRPNEARYDVEAEQFDLVSGASTMKSSQIGVEASELNKALELISREAFEIN